MLRKLGYRTLLGGLGEQDIECEQFYWAGFALHIRFCPMKAELAALVRKQWGAAAWVLCGASLMSISISILDFVQGHVLNDWSGIAPVNRLGAIPYRIAVSIVVAFLVGTAAILAQRPPLNSRLKQMAFGATCGLATSFSLLGPWISRSDEFAWFVVILTLPVAFWVRDRLGRSNVA
jgi:hypothetical protein